MSRRIFVMNRITLDGFYAGPNGEIDWFIRDPAVDLAAHEIIQPDTILFGRLTYQMFANVWPQVAEDDNAPEEARVTANELNQLHKIVYSRTLREVTWANSELAVDDLLPHVQQLRQDEGNDIIIFGSGSIVQQLMNAGLIDEYLLIVSPVVLGLGKSLFQDVQKSPLNLIESRSFESGNVLIHYKLSRS